MEHGDAARSLSLLPAALRPCPAARWPVRSSPRESCRETARNILEAPFLASAWTTICRGRSSRRNPSISRHSFTPWGISSSASEARVPAKTGAAAGRPESLSFRLFPLRDRLRAVRMREKDPCRSMAGAGVPREWRTCGDSSTSEMGEATMLRKYFRIRDFPRRDGR